MISSSLHTAWQGSFPDNFLLSSSVSKTNLSVHEDKNRVPYVKVRANLLSRVKHLVKLVCEDQ